MTSTEAKRIELTQGRFELFKRECERWIGIFGLISWRRDYFFTKLTGNIAECDTFYADRVVCLSLNTSIPSFEGIDDARIEGMVRAAGLHEVLELLVSPLESLAEARIWDRSEWDKERHMVIRSLEGVIQEHFINAESPKVWVYPHNKKTSYDVFSEDEKEKHRLHPGYGGEVLLKKEDADG